MSNKTVNRSSYSDDNFKPPHQIKKSISLNDLILSEKETPREMSPNEKSTKMSDKIKYFINSMTVYITLFLIFTRPSYYPYFSAVVLALQIIHRYFEFSTYRWQFYLLDFCYVVNFLTIIYVFFPKNFSLYIAAFGLANGPILITIFTYKMTMGLHNTIKFTSYWTHFAPGLSMFIVRWHDTENFFYGVNNLNDKLVLNLTQFIEYLLTLFFIYFIWVIPYYFINFIWKYDYILENDYENTFFYMFKKEGSFSTRSRLLSYGERWAPFFFQSWHFRYVLVTSIFSFFFFFYYYLGFFCLFSLFLYGIWNAGCYYIDYFPLHYMDQFKDDYKIINRVLKTDINASNAKLT